MNSEKMKKKKLWQRPVTQIQAFTPEAYVAVCGYTWSCSCKTDANNGTYYYLYDDTNGNGQLDTGDKLVYGGPFEGFRGCGTEHNVESVTKPTFNGFVSTRRAGTSSSSNKVQRVFWWGTSSDPHACYDPGSSKNVS